MWKNVELYLCSFFFSLTNLGKCSKNVIFFASELSSKGFSLTEVILLKKMGVSSLSELTPAEWHIHYLLSVAARNHSESFSCETLFFENTDFLQTEVKLKWTKWKRTAAPNCQYYVFFDERVFTLTNTNCWLFSWGLKSELTCNYLTLCSMENIISCRCLNKPGLSLQLKPETIIFTSC